MNDMAGDRVLVAYGSKRGGTAEIAQWIGIVLRENGVQSDVRPAADVRSLDGYSAVIVGGALYSGHWSRGCPVTSAAEARSSLGRSPSPTS